MQYYRYLLQIIKGFLVSACGLWIPDTMPLNIWPFIIFGVLAGFFIIDNRINDFHLRTIYYGEAV